MQLRRTWVKKLTLSLCTRISAGRVPWVSSVKLRKYRNILSNYTNSFLPHSSQYFIRYHFIIRRHIKLAASLNKTQINILVSFMTLVVAVSLVHVCIAMMRSLSMFLARQLFLCLSQTTSDGRLTSTLKYCGYKSDNFVGKPNESFQRFLIEVPTPTSQLVV